MIKSLRKYFFYLMSGFTFYYIFISFIACDNGGHNSRLKIKFQSLQYNVFETFSFNGYYAWVEVTKDGVPVQETDVNDVYIVDSDDNVISPLESEYLQYSFIDYDCTTLPCIESGPIEGTGFFQKYNYLPADAYQIEVFSSDEKTVRKDVAYGGQILMPVVGSSTMESIWSNGDLIFNWSNPTDDTNWEKVDQLYIVIFDSSWKDVLYVKLGTEAETITIPKSLLNRSFELENRGLAGWEIQTRAYDTNGMNIARGYSNRVALSYSIDLAYIQFRNYISSGKNEYATYIGISKNGRPIQSDDIVVCDIIDPLGTTFNLKDNFHSSSLYLYYECDSSPCFREDNFQDNVFVLQDSGFYSSFYLINRGDYQFNMETLDGQKFTLNVEFPDKILLPNVDPSTCLYQWSNGDLILKWSNPKEHFNWNEVDKLYVILFDIDYSEIFYIMTNPKTETVTIPEPLLDVSKIRRERITYWMIMTLSHDVHRMNYARGYSSFNYIE